MLQLDELLLHREIKDSGRWINLDITSDYICYRAHTIPCSIVRLMDTEEVRTDVEERYYSVGSGTNKRSQSVSVYPIEFFHTGNTTADDRLPKADATIYATGRQMQLEILAILEKREER